MPRPREDNDGGLRIVVPEQRLHGIPTHRRVPGALGVQHRLPLLVVHRGVKALVVEARLEEAQVVGIAGVDLGRDVRGFLGRQSPEALLAHGRDDVPGRVDGDHPQPVVAGEKKDIAVVEPVVAPIPVPPRDREEFVLGESAGAPVVEGFLLRVRKHLEADRDLPPRSMELFDHAPLDAVGVHVGVALAHDHEPRGGEPPGQVGRRQDGPRGRVGDGVEHDGSLAALARGVADRKLQEILRRRRRREEGGREKPANGRHDLQGETATISTWPSCRFTRSPGREPSSLCANSDS